MDARKERIGNDRELGKEKKVLEKGMKKGKNERN